jgi:hypothetical protein
MATDLLTDLAVTVRALDDAGCNWCPDEDEPTVAVLVLQLLGDEPGAGPCVVSRRELLRRIAERGKGAPVPPTDAPSLRRLAQVRRTARRYREARERAGAPLRPSGVAP